MDEPKCSLVRKGYLIIDLSVYEMSLKCKTNARTARSSMKKSISPRTTSHEDVPPLQGIRHCAVSMTYNQASFNFQPPLSGVKNKYEM